MFLLRPYRSGGGAPLLVGPTSEVGSVGASLAVQYLVIPPTPVGQDYAASHRVLTSASGDLSGAWSTLNAVAQPVSGQFVVNGVVLELKRLLKPHRAANGNKVLAVVTPSSRPVLDLTVRWNMGGVVAKDLAPAWNVQPPSAGGADWLGDTFVVSLGGVSASGTVAMDSPLATVSRDLIGQYQLVATPSGGVDWGSSPFAVAMEGINASGAVAITSAQMTVSQDLVAQWAMKSVVQASYTSRHTIYTSVGNEYSGSYALTGLSAVSSDLVSEYQMAGVVGAQRIFSHGVLNATGRAFGGSFSILDPNSVSLEILPRWNVLGPVYADLPSSYASAGRLWSDYIAAWTTGEIPLIGVVVIPEDDPVQIQTLVPQSAALSVVFDGALIETLQ